MAVVTLNQYKGTFNGGSQETVVAESMIKAATLLTDESAGTEPFVFAENIGRYKG